jgi:iron complex transport system substrate-binding protein
MRICSFIPGATEVVAALGLADHLVGISHECDFPSSVRHIPIMVEPVVGHEPMGSADIDRQVKDLASTGQHLYRLNESALLAAQPDVILAQDLCHVCAVTPDQLRRVLRSLPTPPRMVTLNPASLNDVVNDVERIAAALGQSSKGRDLAQSLRQRIATVRARAAALPKRPRVVCLEWLSPLYIGGHWIPEMVEIAGGLDVLGQMNQPSREVGWNEVAAAQPDIVILMPCGFSVERTLAEIASLSGLPNNWSRALASWPHTYVVDAGSYFSRPGPRLVEGLELLAAIFSGSARTQFDASVAQDITGTPLAESPSP